MRQKAEDLIESPKQPLQIDVEKAIEWYRATITSSWQKRRNRHLEKPSA